VRYQLAVDEPLTLAGEDLDPKAAFSPILGRSSALAIALEMAERASARQGAPVLIVGEAGTGKELFARAIHGASRARAALEGAAEEEAPFLSVNCAALPSWLLEAELFGRERPDPVTGVPRQAGLLELARGGTLLLDEVDAIPLDLQPKLLKVLEEGRVRRAGGYDEMDVRCRLFAATSEPLDESVVRGRIRDDLHHRLSTGRVWIPPLRDRDGDLPILARHFLEELAEHRGLSALTLSSDSLTVLEGHNWPGNVRELRAVLAEAADRCEGEAIRPEHLSLGARTRVSGGEGGAATGFIAIPSDGRSMASVEAEAVRLTLEITGWNKSAAARILEISRPTLARKIDRYGLSPEGDSGRGR
jgi:two-component system, NtrC family, response regulator HydG